MWDELIWETNKSKSKIMCACECDCKIEWEWECEMACECKGEVPGWGRSGHWGLFLAAHHTGSRSLFVLSRTDLGNEE